MSTNDGSSGPHPNGTGAVTKAAHAETLSEEIRRLTGLNPARCYQCGKCSAGCPMAEETELRPHDVLRMVALGRREKLLTSKSLWLCVGCEACTERCPNECDPAAIIDTLRAMAVRESPAGLPRSFTSFHRVFLDQIRAHGRLSELRMMIGFKMRTGTFLSDATAGPGMVARRKLNPIANNIKGVDEVRAIFERCEKEERQ